MTSSNTDIPLAAFRSMKKGEDNFANCASGKLEIIVVEGITKVYPANGKTSTRQTDLETQEGVFDVVVKSADVIMHTASHITVGWMWVAGGF
ncbi:hypothetical protein M404DRAFT_1005981 [Pisolithus tinctorius Marx 270]|uniref:Uncharacterized protein n=1 Tax=Pisolithus tinctorius Marx 270 TaxID=870435 RepID=A0A0C3JJ00_PISTI|nr:hypothetical protein M404DRAFT_1005981 [Pisolithus tinctorius Marx 270]